MFWKRRKRLLSGQCSSELQFYVQKCQFLPESCTKENISKMLLNVFSKHSSNSSKTFLPHSDFVLSQYKPIKTLRKLISPRIVDGDSHVLRPTCCPDSDQTSTWGGAKFCTSCAQYLLWVTVNIKISKARSGAHKMQNPRKHCFWIPSMCSDLRIPTHSSEGEERWMELWQLSGHCA